MSAADASAKATIGLGMGALGTLGALKVRDDRYVASIWRSLEEIARGSGETFGLEMVEGLPEPARRYFLHAIRLGTPLASGFHWRYHGSLRTGRDAPWMNLRADQLLVRDRGFVWKARVTRGPLLMTGADHYLDGDSRMRIAAFGLVPVVNASGPDIARSASARLLIEGIALPPALLPGPNVEVQAVDESRFRVVVTLREGPTPITIAVDGDGRPTEVTLERWGDYTLDRSYRLIPYGSALGEEATFGNYTIPTRLAAGWWHGTPDYAEVVRVKVDWIQYI